MKNPRVARVLPPQSGKFLMLPLLQVIVCVSILASYFSPSIEAVRAADVTPKATTEIPLFVKTLQPIDSGRAVLVCEPVAPKNDPALTDFGASCGRWLHFVVGGHGEFGSTPIWEEVGIAAHERKHADLQLTQADLPAFGKALGITHAAIGTISGTPGQTTLSYQPWSLSPLKKDGELIEIKGSQDQILEQLPKVATEIVSRWGIEKPRVPLVQISALDMRLLGTLPWCSLPFLRGVQAAVKGASREDDARLSKLAWKVPFVEMMFAQNGSHYVRQTQQEGQLQFNNMCDNVLYQEAMPYNSNLIPVFEAQAGRSLAAFPDNYALLCSVVKARRAGRERAKEREAAELAARSASKNPFAWMQLDGTVGNQAQDMRRGRFYSDLSEEEKQVLEGLYSTQLQIASYAAQLAPESASTWLRLSKAATFVGEDEVATNALWKANSLAPDNMFVYSWGIEIFQPKWFDDEENFVKVASLVIEHPLRLITLQGELLNALKVNGLDKQAQVVEGLILPAYQKLVRDTSDNRIASFYLLQQRYFMERATPKDTKQIQREVVAFADARPDYAPAQYEAGLVMHPEPSSDVYLKKAMTLEPTWRQPLIAFGTFHMKDDPAAAEQAFLKAVELEPTDYWAKYYLAQLSFDKRDYEQAVIRAKDALTSKFFGKKKAHIILVQSLLELGRKKEAQEAFDAANKAHMDIYADFPDKFPATATKPSGEEVDE
jgi:tetratricopeptide (TPR) repeat protein